MEQKELIEKFKKMKKSLLAQGGSMRLPPAPTSGVDMPVIATDMG